MFRKFLNDKWLFKLTVIIYFFMILLTLLFVRFRIVQLEGNGRDVNEPNVDLLFVYGSNLVLVFKNIVIGFFTFGAYPLYVVVQNSIAIGIVMNHLFSKQHYLSGLKSVPHGLIEYFQIALSLAVVLKCMVFSYGEFIKIVKKEIKIRQYVDEVSETLKLVLLLELVIFLSAAIVEVLVSWVKVL